MSHIILDPGAGKQRQEWKLAGIVFFALLAIAVLYATYVILEPFLAPIMLGAVLVTVTYPIYRRIRAKLNGSANKAATAMLFLITFTILLPSFLIIVLLVQEANVVVKHLQSGDRSAAARLDISNHAVA
jgi:predicted PurR-regulated permease PerM